MNKQAGLAAGQGDQGARSDMIRDFAPAKVNLSLEISGRRPDGYHELISLVAFADVGDTLSFRPGGTRQVTLEADGPFATSIEGDNLILRAARVFLEHAPDARGGHFILDKQLPVAAGIGGGSSDAAAAVRLLARANGLAVGPSWRQRLVPALSRLGADIPVCLEARAAWMRGIGEHLTPLDAMPVVPAVLVNPGVPLPTGDVFAALGAPPLGDAPPSPSGTPRAFADAARLTDFLAARPNDLERPARILAPAIGEVLEALQAAPGCVLARLSGSGPTCFGIFGHVEAASEAACALARAQPGWWIAPAQLS